MMLVMVLVLSELLISDVTADVVQNGTLAKGQLEAETDQGQELEKRGARRCANGWVYYRDLSMCYNFLFLRKSWINAELYCQALVPGGHLASIHWGKQNKFIEKVTKLKGRSAPLTWIGLSHIHKVWTFLWSDGSSLDFTNWYMNQPNNRNKLEKCVQINYDSREK
ncbi:lectin-like isoform X2 [Heterodontus francisci]|uniref:lectin-like isoform X2 n=1 Tax=Heterodontus francisci TaxID=7792 RepID=UPI00355AE505